VRHCRAALALAVAAGDEHTRRYLLFTLARIWNELRQSERAVACASELLARSEHDAQPFWRAKALGMLATSAILDDDPARAVDLLADAWTALGEVDGRSYNQVSASAIVASTLLRVDLHEASYGLLHTLHESLPAPQQAFILSDSVRTLAEWGVRLVVCGYPADGSRKLAALAARARMLERSAQESGHDDMLSLVDAALAFAEVGAGRAHTVVDRLGVLVDRLSRREGRIEWYLAATGYAYALHRTGRDREAGAWAARVRDVAVVRADDVWMTAADGIALLVALRTRGTHPAVGRVVEMYARTARRLWEERLGRFSSVEARMRIHVLVEESARATRMSALDPLTGIGNRRAIQDALRSRPGPVSALFVDVDKFKDVNDRYSHVLGDDVLRRLARILAGAVREGDLLARYGGDEFVVIFGAGHVEPDVVAARVLAAVRAEPWSLLAAGLRVGVSVGVATVAAPRDLLADLSRAVLTAKRSGRDRSAHPPTRA